MYMMVGSYGYDGGIICVWWWGHMMMMVGSYGVLAVEAMALKKPVVGYINPSILKHFPVELPIINCNPETLKSTLFEWLAADAAQYKKHGDASRRYVEKYHASGVVSRKFKNILQSL